LYFMNTGQDSIYLSLENCCISTQGKAEPSFYGLPIDPSPSPSFILDPSVYQMSPLISGGDPEPLVQSSLVNMVTLYLGSRLKVGVMMSTPISGCVSEESNICHEMQFSCLFSCVVPI
jgi:hypothetical protein